MHGERNHKQMRLYSSAIYGQADSSSYMHFEARQVWKKTRTFTNSLFSDWMRNAALLPVQLQQMQLSAFLRRETLHDKLCALRQVAGDNEEVASHFGIGLFHALRVGAGWNRLPRGARLSFPLLYQRHWRRDWCHPGHVLGYSHKSARNRLYWLLHIFNIGSLEYIVARAWQFLLRISIPEKKTKRKIKSSGSQTDVFSTLWLDCTVLMLLNYC